MLPKIDVPIYELKLVSLKKPIRFRPFLVKEQKLLLMAQEAFSAENGESDSALNSVRQILNNCILSEVDVDSLPLFDIEYLFLNLRARSMGEMVTLSYRCSNEVKDEDGEAKRCNNIVNYEMNLLDIKPKILPEHSEKIEINDKMGILMSYPRLELLNSIDAEGGDEETVMKLIFSCIDAIYDEETIYYTKDTPKEELEEFVDSLPTNIIDKIKNFFDTTPKIQETLHFKCNKCEYEEDIVLEGINSFFV